MEKKNSQSAKMGESMTVSLGFRKIDGRMLGRRSCVSLEIFLPRMVNKRPVGIESNARPDPVRSSRSLCGVAS
jgi:hypothetical protein